MPVHTNNAQNTTRSILSRRNIESNSCRRSKIKTYFWLNKIIHGIERLSFSRNNSRRFHNRRKNVEWKSNLH